jgi:hypothetical protein
MLAMRARTHTPSTVKTSSRFVIKYLNGNLRRYGNGHSLPVVAATPEEAVLRVFGGPAETWDGNHFTMWGGKLRARVEEVRR